MSAIDSIAIIVVLGAVLGWINHRYLGLPHTVGLTVTGAAAGLAIIGADAAFPALHLADPFRRWMTGIDFQDTLMSGMLSMLLFAGALPVDLADLLQRRWVVGALATLSVVISTLVIGYGLALVSAAIGQPLPLKWALVFGALISPTDPVAVMSLLKTVGVARSIEMKIVGESLFNDGVGVVVFTIALGSATGTGFALTDAFNVFLYQAVGGAVFGLLCGWLAYQGVKRIDEHDLEVMITLALVLGGYAMAQALGVSGPVAMVVAGLFFGNHAATTAMSDNTRDHLEKFWSLLDMILNSGLFLLIGMQVVTIPWASLTLALGLTAIPLTLIARAISVGLPLLVLARSYDAGRGAFPILVWGGLRGGISIALALSLAQGETEQSIVTVTYLVVLFSVIVQGTTVGLLARHAGGTPLQRQAA